MEAATRVMANELPQSRIRLVGLALRQAARKHSTTWDELRSIRLDRHDAVVAVRSEGRFVQRIVVVDAEVEEKLIEQQHHARGKYFCEADSNGSLDSIIIGQQLAVNLGADEVAIEVHAAGLNFKDVTNGLGLLSERSVSGAFAGQKLGLEVGRRVKKNGERMCEMLTSVI
jgi:hypothetical protein